MNQSNLHSYAYAYTCTLCVCPENNDYPLFHIIVMGKISCSHCKVKPKPVYALTYEMLKSLEF